MSRTRAALPGLALLLAASAVGAQRAPHYPIQQFALANGLHVILSEDHSAPVVGLALAYDVGSRNEQRGRSGFAHLFEHMMFQGSAHVAKEAHDRYIESNGGMANGFTRSEDTTYIETAPAEKLPLMLWLEADRMRSLNISAENLKNQQEVVKEEKRLRYDNQPYVNARNVQLDELAYTNFANQHSTIGSMADLDAASLADVQSFFRTYYAPNDATLVLVGDFDPRTAKSLVEQQFGAIPRQPPPPKLALEEAPQTEERRKTVTDQLVHVPALAIAWHGPSLSSPDHYALDLLSSIVFTGESSRAYQQLVKGKQIALDIEGSMDAQRGPSLYSVFAVYRAEVPEADMEQAIYAQLESIKAAPPSADELERAKTKFLAEYYSGVSIFGLQTMLGRAVQIADYAVFQGDPNLINTEMARYTAVTPAQVQAAARKYFRPENRSVIVIKPGAAGGPQ